MKILLYALVVFLSLGCSSDEASTQNEVVEKKTQVNEQSKTEVTETVDEVKEVVAEVSQELTTEPKESVEEMKQKVVVAKKDGSALYRSCAACHGADGSKVALGKSAVIKGWSSQKIADSLNGYKDGTYGGAMKGLMSGQVKKLSSEDIEVLSEYISKF